MAPWNGLFGQRASIRAAPSGLLRIKNISCSVELEPFGEAEQHWIRWGHSSASITIHWTGRFFEKLFLHYSSCAAQLSFGLQLVLKEPLGVVQTA